MLRKSHKINCQIVKKIIDALGFKCMCINIASHCSINIKKFGIDYAIGKLFGIEIHKKYEMHNREGECNTRTYLALLFWALIK